MLKLVIMLNGLKDEETVYAYLQRNCRDAGITMSEACKRANVPFSTVSHWAESEPSPIGKLRKLDKVITSALLDQYENIQKTLAKD